MMDIQKEYAKAVLRHSEPKTNADRIRAMTDEELARLFDDVLKYNVVGEPDENVCCDCHKTDCAPCWLEWLRQEEKDEDS